MSKFTKKLTIIWTETSDCEHCGDMPQFYPRVKNEMYCLSCVAANGMIPDTEADRLHKLWEKLYGKAIDALTKKLRKVKPPKVEVLGTDEVDGDEDGYDE